jgi:PAS domain S-box-containing protein
VSEFINNREYRKKVLKELIKELHEGKSVDEVKPRFEELIKGVSVQEIAEIEQTLIKEGMPVEEIQRLCDVHAAVFKGSIEEIHRPQKPEETPGHPIHTFKLENQEIQKLIEQRIKPHLKSFETSDNPENIRNLNDDFALLWEIDKHYSRKEHLLFPFMEKYGITAPPKVMWGVDDEIRDSIKEVRALLANYTGNKEQVIAKANEAINKAEEMIFKEENILFPMVLDTLSEDEWIKIEQASDEFGYTLTQPAGNWQPVRVNIEQKAQAQGEHPSGTNEYVQFDAGILSPREINAIFNTLPIDITFVDKEGIVKYFSQGKERIFARPKTIIGRRVENCHPPTSVHIVQKIVENLKSGKKDHEDFWIRMGDKYVFIRYFAVRDNNGDFLGVLEVTQDIKPIQEITGEKRLLDQE